MSFVFDLPALFVLGVALYFVGKKHDLERLTKITIGILIALSFISISTLLYANIFLFPSIQINNFSIIPSGMNGSNFTLNWPVYPFIINDPSKLISQDNFPLLFAIILLLLYPVAIYLGYAFALLYAKKRRRRLLIGSRSYEDVRSRTRIEKDPVYSVVRYPDNQRGINNLKDAVGMAVADLGGMKHFIKQGNTVLIKANICGGNPDISATYTSQEVVGYVVDMVREAGGEPFICDADMVWAKFWVQVKAAGWDEWAKKKNVTLVNLTETELVYFDFGEDTLFQHNEKPNHEVVSTKVLDADVIISIPKMKTHLSTNVSLGMKNMYGTLPEEDKAYYHQKGGVEELLYWVNYAFTPTLTIIDGSEGGEAEGPLAAHSVQYNTIIASNNVVVADAIAAKLMGYEHPFKDIKFLRFAEDMIGEERSLLNQVPTELQFTALQLVSKWELPANSKDGKWQLADPKVVEETQNFMENLFGIPGAATLYNIGADFVLLDAARLPYWRILETALLQILFAPRFWIKKARETALERNRMQINLAIFAIIALVSLYFFIGYLPKDLKGLNSSLGYILGFALAIILGAFFSRMMQTKHLVAISLSSLVIAYFVESFAPWAEWWKYLKEGTTSSVGWFGLPAPPHYPLFAVPIFIIAIIGLSHAISPMLFSLKGRRFRLVPYAVIILALFVFLYLEGYLTPPASSNIDISTRTMIIIYSAMAIVGLYFNEKQNLDWNIALVLVAVASGFIMEYLGAMSGFWSYPKVSGAVMPMFVPFTWALNAWAACGLALIFGMNMREAFVKDEVFDAKDPQAWNRKGDSLLKEGAYDKAIEHYDKAIDILTCKDRDEVTNGNHDKASSTDNLLALGEAWYGKGTALASKGNFADSLTDYDKAIEQYANVYPDIPGVQIAEAWYREAFAFQNLVQQGFDRPEVNSDDEAKEASQSISAWKIDTEKTLFAHQALNAYKKASNACQQAISVSPQATDLYVEISVDKAMALQQLGRFEEAVEAYNESVAFFERNSSKQAELYIFKGFAQVYFADVNSEKRMYNNAIQSFDNAYNKISEIKDSDKFWLASVRWGKSYAKFKLQDHSSRQKDFEESIIEDLNRAIIELGCTNAAFVWSDLGDVYMDQKRHEDALNAYETALDQIPEMMNIQIVHAWRGNGDVIIKLAAHIWEGMGDAHSKIAESIKNVVNKLEAEDNALKAYRMSVEFLEKLGNDSDALSGKGLVLFEMGRYKEALIAYEKSLVISESDETRSFMRTIKLLSSAKAWAGMGDALAKMGDDKKALEAFGKSREKVGDYAPAINSIVGLLSKSKVIQPGKKPLLMPENLEKAKDADPRYAEIWRHRGAYLILLKHNQ